MRPWANMQQKKFKNREIAVNFGNFGNFLTKINYVELAIRFADLQPKMHKTHKSVSNFHHVSHPSVG